MKKTVFFLSFLFLFAGIGFAQFIPLHKKVFIYGKMVNSKKELAGYFWFDNENISTNGQTVYYKESLEANDYKTFQSRKYDYFVSDSLYMETFAAIDGEVKIMIPRIVDGEIQLFGFRFTRTIYVFKSNKDHFFVKTGTTKLGIRKKKFKEQMKDLIGKDQVLLGKINSGELTYDDLPEIINAYNQNSK